MSTSDNAIVVNNISKSFKIPIEGSNGIKQKLINTLSGKVGYRKFTPLKDISFEVKKGEFFGIVGRNGSGKSTLLKIISNIYTTNSGQVHVSGTLVPFIELGVGFNPELTGRENVFLNGALLGFSHSEMSEMYDEIVRFAELEDFMDERLKNYSSGMQVRLAFSIAIRAESDILLLDEVLAVGDTNFQSKCFDFFNKIRHEKTIIFVSHDMGSVKRFCDRALLLEKGKILEIGKAEDIALKYGGIMARDEVSVTKDSKYTDKGIHIGTGGVRITKIETLNESNKVVNKIMPGSPFKIKVSFDLLDDKLTDLGFLVSIFDSNSHKLFSATTHSDNVSIKKMLQSREYTMFMKQNVFGSGIYKVNVGIFNGNMSTPYDHFRDAFEFTIAGDRKSDSNLRIDHEWE